MTVTTVMHFVTDPKGTAEWWAKQFGGSVQVDQCFAWFTVDDVEVGFHPADVSKNPTGASTVVYWKAEDFDTTRQRLLDAGCEPWRGPLNVADGRRICQLKDPFGIVFGLDSGGRS